MFKKKKNEKEVTEVEETLPTSQEQQEEIVHESEQESGTETESEKETEMEQEQEPVPEQEEDAAQEEDTEQEEDAEPAMSLEEAYCLGAGIDKETLVQAKELLTKIATAVNSNAFDPGMLRLAISILNRDKEKKRSAAAEAAAIPHFTGTKGSSGIKSDSIFEMARNAK